MTNTLSRRAALSGAVASVAIAASASAVAMPIAAPAGISPGLAAAIAAYRAANDAADRYASNVYDPRRARYEAAVSALPHTTINLDEGAFRGEDVVWSTAKPASVSVAKTIVRIAKEGGGGDARDIARARRLLAAHLRRERAQHRESRSIGLDVAIAESNRLGDASADAMCAVGAYPVSTAADLAAKLAFMVELKMGDGMDWMEELHADALRIAKMEAAA